MKQRPKGGITILSQEEYKYIVLKHLCNMYDEETAVKLFQNGESTIFEYHGLAYALGKQNFHFFCEFFLHDFLFDYSGEKIPLSKTHYQIWDELNDTMLNRKNTKTVYVMPRGFGKTATINVPLVIWTAMYCIHPLIVIQSMTQQRAENFIEDIKAQIEENELLKMCFGEYLNKNLKYNASEIELDLKPQRVKIQAVSAKASVRGINYQNYRIGLLIEDDAQSDDDLNTEESRKIIVDRFETDALKALQSQNYHVIALGTVQKVNDLYDTLLKRVTWKRRIEKCIPIDDIDIYFRNNPHWMKVKEILSNIENQYAIEDAEDYYLEHREEMEFPVIWKKFECLQLFKDWLENPVAFKKEIQCDIYNLGEKRIHSLSAIPEMAIESIPFNKTILSVDPAATNKKKSDYYAFCILSEGNNFITDKNGYRHSIKYARKSIIDKMDYDSYINKVIDLLVKYTDINTLSIEKNVYMGADKEKIEEMIRNHPQLKNRPLTIINKSRVQNKDSRIDAIIPDINMGRIIFNENDYAAIEQIREFAGTAFTQHDDMIDALADAVQNIATVTTGGTYKFVSFRDIGYF